MACCVGQLSFLNGKPSLAGDNGLSYLPYLISFLGKEGVGGVLFASARVLFKLKSPRRHIALRPPCFAVYFEFDLHTLELQARRKLAIWKQAFLWECVSMVCLCAGTFDREGTAGIALGLRIICRVLFYLLHGFEQFFFS